MNKEQQIITQVHQSYQHKEELRDLIDKHTDIVILGNGGSSSIASHISQDYTKQLNKRSFTFSDPSRLTCYSNDYGYEQAYVQFLKEFVRSDESTLVILISSSGNSPNIIHCGEWCDTQKNIEVITMTGFSKENILKTMKLNNRKINYWVDSDDYGIVECIHMIFLHMVV